MIQILIKKNQVPSNSQKYSNYIYTYETEFTNDCSDPEYFLPYQIETNKAYKNYLECSTNIEKFRIAIQLEENYQTIMNLCVISLINRNFEEFDALLNKAVISAADQTHHTILLAEYCLLIHDYNKALEHLIFLFNNQKLHDAVENLLKEVCSRKLFSRQHLSNLVSDNNMLEQIIKINKQSFVQHHSNISQQGFQSKHTQGSQFNLQYQHSKEQSVSQIQSQSNLSQSDKTQLTDQLSFISQNNLNSPINESQFDFIFLDTIMENQHLFQLGLYIPYMIGSYDIKRINKLSSKIAEGGYGEVFLAKHLQTNDILALKVIKQQEDQQVEIVLQEIIIQDKIQQLNPQLYLNLKPLVYIKKDSTLVDVYIPLELASFSLYEYIREYQINEIEYNQFFNLFIDFIVTLHTHKYAHRDIKPQNILYIKDKGWKLADFGESVNYIDAEDVYKIRGTYAFLPLNLRKNHQKKISEIKQNLLYNDVYAVVCTLVLIKNPNFNLKQLEYFMDSIQYDLQLQQLFDNFKDLQLLKKLKVNQIQYIETRLILNQKMQDLEDSLSCLEKLAYYKDHHLQLDDEFIKKLDEQLGLYKYQQQKYQRIYLSIQISFSCPYQIEAFKNIIIFSFLRNLLADLENLDYQNINYYRLAIDYFISIKLYDFAIKVCDQLNNKQYDIRLHLQKIQALIILARMKEAKDELELASRYFLSVQSFNVKVQLSFTYNDNAHSLGFYSKLEAFNLMLCSMSKQQGSSGACLFLLFFLHHYMSDWKKIFYSTLRDLVQAFGVQNKLKIAFPYKFTKNLKSSFINIKGDRHIECIKDTDSIQILIILTNLNQTPHLIYQL